MPVYEAVALPQTHKTRTTVEVRWFPAVRDASTRRLVGVCHVDAHSEAGARLVAQAMANEYHARGYAPATDPSRAPDRPRPTYNGPKGPFSD